MKSSLVHRSLAAVCLCALLLPSPAFAQPPQSKKFDLTIDTIMRGPAEKRALAQAALAAAREFKMNN